MFKKIIFFIPFIYLFVLLFQLDKSFTQDLGRHIKTGKIIVECACVPKTNLYSYTEPNQPFINHHWLSEVVFYLLSDSFGSHSLIVLKVFLVMSSFGIVYVFSWKKNPFWTTVVSFPYVYLFSDRFDIRPELFSFLFISLFVFLIQKYRETKNSFYLTPLPVIELFWVNAHIYFIVGVILLAFLVFEDIFVFIVKTKTRKLQSLKSPIVLIVVSVITLINPNGVKGALAPFTIFSNYGYSIVENQNIFFLNTFFFSPHILMFELLALLLVIFSIATLKQTIFSLLTSIFSIAAAIKMLRNFPVFTLATFFYAVNALCNFEEKLSMHRKNLHLVKVTLVVIVAFFVVITSVSSIFFPRFGFGYVEGAEKAVDFLEKNNIKGPIFNNFDIGSYLLFRLYPKEKVFVDGRPEAYSVEFFDEYKKMQEDQLFFKQQVDRYKINTIFFAHTDITPWAQTFLSSITKDSEWKTVYLDERIIILIRK